MRTRDQLFQDLNNSRFKKGDTIKIESFAGTGKTTTLEKIFEHFPEKQILYLVFNKDMQKEAKSRMKKFRNVKVSTIHSLAYQFFKKEFRTAKLENFDLSPLIIQELFGLEDLVNSCRILNEYKEFLASSVSINDLKKEIPTNLEIDKEIKNKALKEGKEIKEYFYFLPDKRVKFRFSKFIVNILKKQLSGEIHVTHDLYLKLFQLSKPDLSNYDLIAVDEAQDITWSILDIVQNQKSLKIFVGDRYQNIYGFRKTINALEEIKTEYEYELNVSYRIGQPIADLSMNILSKRYNTSLNIIGNNISKVSSLSEIQSGDKIYKLARKSITLLLEAQECLDCGIKYRFIGGINKYGVNTALNFLKYGSIYYNNKRINKAQIREIYEETEDPELGILLAIENKFRTEDNLNLLVMNEELKDEDAEVILTTAHRSKGLEWDNVELLNDFELIPSSVVKKDAITGEESTKSILSDKQEFNLFYVAITRAKKNLILPFSIKNQIEYINTL